MRELFTKSIEKPFNINLKNNFDWQVFDGEEFSMAARLWTRGYDFYTPDLSLIGHDYNQVTKFFFFYISVKIELCIKASFLFDYNAKILKWDILKNSNKFLCIFTMKFVSWAVSIKIYR